MTTHSKYVIECQNCRGSLTIIYSVHGEKWETPAGIKQHLANLIETHHSMIPGPDHKPPRGTPKNKKDWVQRVRPLTRPRNNRVRKSARRN